MILAHSHFVDLMFLSFSLWFAKLSYCFSSGSRQEVVDSGSKGTFYDGRGFKTPMASGVYGAVAACLKYPGNPDLCLRDGEEDENTRLFGWVCLMPFFKTEL